MIEQWLNEEITKKLKNRGRVVLIDQDRQWEFLATAAINKLPFYKVKDFSESWRRKKEELFLRCVAEEEHPEGGRAYHFGLSGGDQEHREHFQAAPGR